MNCPCCNNGINKLKYDVGQYVKCVLNHRFKVTLEGLNRVLEVVSDPEGCVTGTRFPVTGDDETFDD